MKKHLITRVLAAALLSSACCSFAALDVIEIAPGRSARATAPAKVVAVRVLSATAAGTATVKTVSTFAATELTPVVAESTNLTFTVVATNYVAGSLVTVTNTTPFDPWPYGHDNWISFATNSVVAYSTNWVETVTSSLFATNAITGQLTCSGGFAESVVSNKFLVPGEPIFYEGTADGKVLVITER